MGTRLEKVDLKWVGKKIKIVKANQGRFVISYLSTTKGEKGSLV